MGLMFDPKSMFHCIPTRVSKINDSHAQTTKELVIKLFEAMAVVLQLS